jgi:hypothetical protein
LHASAGTSALFFAVGVRSIRVSKEAVLLGTTATNEHHAAALHSRDIFLFNCHPGILAQKRSNNRGIRE